MSNAFDSSSGNFVNPGTSLTVAHTCSGVNRILFVNVIGDFTDTVTGVTYAGAAMTLVAKGVGSARWLYLFYLIAPATGTNNIVATGSTSGYLEINAASYNGAAQVAPEANSTAAFGSASSFSRSVTTLTNNAWVVMSSINQAGSPSGGSGTTFRNGALIGGILDSGGPITPPALTTLTVNQASSNDIGALVAAFAPVGGGGGSAIGAISSYYRMIGAA